MNNRRTCVFVSLVVAGSVLMPVAHADDSFSLPVEAAAVSRTALMQRIETVGTLRASEKVTLRPELGGRVERILFEDGQQVEEGRELLILDTAIREAELADAKARSLLAASEFKRNKDVTEKGLGSTQDLDRARAELLRAEAGETLARVRLGKMTLRAPGPGLVIHGDPRRPWDRDRIRVGGEVWGSMVLMTIPDLRVMQVKLRIHEADVNKLDVGQTAKVSMDTYPGVILDGEVTKIDTIAKGDDPWDDDPEVKKFTVEVTLEPTGEVELKPGISAKAEIFIDRKEDVLYVPPSCEQLSPLLTVVPLQMLAYHAAVLRGHDVDKPRNLAKSVTVE